MWFPYASAFAHVEGECTHLRTQKGEFIITGANAVLWKILQLADGTHSVEQIKVELGQRCDPDGLARLIGVLRRMAAIIPANRRYEAFHRTSDNPMVAAPEIQPDQVVSYTRHSPRRHWKGQRLRVDPPDSPFASLLRQRQSARTFSNSSLRFHDLATILWACQGTVGRELGHGIGVPARTAPSGGGLYPLQIFVWSSRVEGLASGISVWEPEGVLISHQPKKPAPMETCLVDPAYAKRAAAIILVTGDIPRSVRKYGDRGYRYVLLEAGHASQNAILAATELNVGSLVLGGFLEVATRQTFQIPPTLQPLIMIVLGVL